MYYICRPSKNLMMLCHSAHSRGDERVDGCIQSVDWTTGLDYWTGLLDSLHERSFSALFTAELPDSRRDIELPKKPKCFRGYVFHVGAHQELPSKRLATSS